MRPWSRWRRTLTTAPSTRVPFTSASLVLAMARIIDATERQLEKEERGDDSRIESPAPVVLQPARRRPNRAGRSALGGPEGLRLGERDGLVRVGVHLDEDRRARELLRREPPVVIRVEQAETAVEIAEVGLRARRLAHLARPSVVARGQLLQQ